jgi:hypothetical protein
MNTKGRVTYLFPFPTLLAIVVSSQIVSRSGVKNKNRLEN